MKNLLVISWLLLGTCFAEDPAGDLPTMRVEKSAENDGKHEIVIVNRSDRDFSFTGYDFSKRVDFKGYFIHYSSQLVRDGQWKDVTPAWDAKSTVPLDLPAGGTLRCTYVHSAASEKPSRFRLTLRLHDGPAKSWDPAAKGIMIASPVYLFERGEFREVTRDYIEGIPPGKYKGVAPSWTHLQSIHDIVQVPTVLESAGRERVGLEDFLSLLPPRYPEAKVMIFSANSRMGGFMRPPTGTSWTARVSIKDGKPAIRESIRESHTPIGPRQSKMERAAEVPEIDATTRVWYFYNREDAKTGNWALETDPPPPHIQRITFSYDLDELRLGKPANLGELVLASPPPRFPVTGGIGIHHPRVDPEEFDVIERDGRYETTRERGVDGHVFYYVWKNPHPAPPRPSS